VLLPAKKRRDFLGIQEEPGNRNMKTANDVIRENLEKLQKVITNEVIENFKNKNIDFTELKNTLIEKKVKKGLVVVFGTNLIKDNKPLELFKTKEEAIAHFTLSSSNFESNPILIETDEMFAVTQDCPDCLPREEAIDIIRQLINENEGQPLNYFLAFHMKRKLIESGITVQSLKEVATDNYLIATNIGNKIDDAKFFKTTEEAYANLLLGLNFKTSLQPNDFYIYNTGEIEENYQIENFEEYYTNYVIPKSNHKDLYYFIGCHGIVAYDSNDTYHGILENYNEEYTGDDFNTSVGCFFSSCEQENGELIHTIAHAGSEDWRGRGSYVYDVIYGETKITKQGCIKEVEVDDTDDVYNIQMIDHLGKVFKVFENEILEFDGLPVHLADEFEHEIEKYNEDESNSSIRLEIEYSNFY
jgi:hypothetical protein